MPVTRCTQARRQVVSPYFTGQGRPYDERGWPTWECAVAQLLTLTLLDRSKISVVDKAPSKQYVQSIIAPLRPIGEGHITM